MLAGLLRRGEEFAAAEDAVQEAVVEALRVWPEHPPRDPRAWLSTVAAHRLVDARRSESARRAREEATAFEQPQGPTEHGDDTLLLLFLCCHPELSPASQVALTLRAVGGLTTREIADAFFVPEATMAQRISRAKRTLRRRSFREPGDLAVVLRVLSLIYRAGHGRRHDLAARGHPAHPPAHLGHARARGARPARADAAPARPARRRAPTTPGGSSRSTSRTARCGTPPRSPTASPSCRARSPRSARGATRSRPRSPRSTPTRRTSAETDWPQILAWYDDLVALSDDPEHDDPAAVLNRAVAVGHVDGARAGLDETERVRAALGDRDQWHAVRAYLHELGGELDAAADEYAAAAERTTERSERDHFVRRAARARARDAELNRSSAR